MKTTHHSEYLKLKSVFIKPSKNAFVSNINLDQQWQELNFLSQPHFDTAINEYKIFEDFIKKKGIDIYHFPFDNTVTIDSIYCRDASIATNF